MGKIKFVTTGLLILALIITLAACAEWREANRNRSLVNMNELLGNAPLSGE